jgi:hypothetical protein
MLTDERTFIKIRAAEFELHKLCASRSSQSPPPMRIFPPQPTLQRFKPWPTQNTSGFQKGALRTGSRGRSACLVAGNLQ